MAAGTSLPTDCSVRSGGRALLNLSPTDAQAQQRLDKTKEKRPGSEHPSRAKEQGASSRDERVSTT